MLYWELQDEQASVRGAAEKALGAPRVGQAIAALCQMLQDEDVFVRQAALKEDPVALKEDPVALKEDPVHLEATFSCGYQQWHNGKITDDAYAATVQALEKSNGTTPTTGPAWLGFIWSAGMLRPSRISSSRHITSRTRISKGGISP